MKSMWLGAACAVAVLGTACGQTTATFTATSPSASPVGVATIAVASNPALGNILVDGRGRTVYLFVADTGTTSTCYTACAQFWPPVLTSGAPMAGAGATAALLGTTNRTDGTTQVTYAGHPLYYVITDTQAGQTSGQAVNNFGALWYVLGPDGKQIT